MRKRKSWMTNTGNALLGIGAAVASAAAVLPDGSEHKDWLLFAGIFSAGIGQVMANKGIRRRLPGAPRKEA
jgi:drug/metabolite transporter (DMT)-like permease